MMRIGALALAASGCSSDITITPHWPVEEDMICVPMETSGYSAPAHSNRHAGHSLDIVTYGNTTTDPNASRVVAVGSPGSETLAQPGNVRLVTAAVASGMLTSTVETLTAPLVSSHKLQFGWAVHGADVRDCFLGTSATYHDACGEEILVGTPEIADPQAKGAVHWYYEQASGNTTFTHGGMVLPPATLTAGAQFGYAIASRHLPPSMYFPWDATPDVPPWVAIGAPGDDAVLVYTVNAATGGFTLVQTLWGPIPGRAFGHALAAADFDNDGVYDLAVGAPDPAGAALEGRVYVYKGTTGPSPLNLTPLELTAFELSGTAVGGVQADAFGSSLAAGRFIGDLYSREALVAGAPSNDFDSPSVGSGWVDQGGVCTLQLDAAATPSGFARATGVGGCMTNPWTESMNTTGEEFGRAVAVGNFVAADSVGVEGSLEAQAHEVAISRPGVAADTGEVDIFLGHGLGVDFHSFGSVIEQYPGTVAGARFGDALAAGFIQESSWNDLAIGAPFVMNGADVDGGATLTQAVDTSACTEIHGTWKALDANGLAKSVQVWTDVSGRLHLTFLEDFAAELRDGGGSGSVCTATWDGTAYDMLFDIGAGTDLNLGADWSCGSTPQTWTDVVGDSLLFSIFDAMGIVIPDWVKDIFPTQYMDVTIDYDSATQHIALDLDTEDFSWDIAQTVVGMDESCRPADLPWGLDLAVAGVCE